MGEAHILVAVRMAERNTLELGSPEKPENSLEKPTHTIGEAALGPMFDTTDSALFLCYNSVATLSDNPPAFRTYEHVYKPAQIDRMLSCRVRPTPN